MACQTVVTQYILPLNQKCVCLEASHWQMPKLEAFPPPPVTQGQLQVLGESDLLDSSTILASEERLQWPGPC